MRNPKVDKKAVRELDWIVWISLAMFICMRIACLVTFNIVDQQTTGAEINAIHTAYEANPLFTATLRMQMAGYVLQFIILPAIAFSIYYYFRRSVLAGKGNYEQLRQHVILIFFLILFNFINDVASLAGRLL